MRGKLAVSGQLWIETVLNGEETRIVDIISHGLNIKVHPDFKERLDLLRNFIDVMTKISKLNNCSQISIDCKNVTKEIMFGQGFRFESTSQNGLYKRDIDLDILDINQRVKILHSKSKAAPVKQKRAIKSYKHQITEIKLLKSLKEEIQKQLTV